jgi:STE24 endopeptidase
LRLRIGLLCAFALLLFSALSATAAGPAPAKPSTALPAAIPIPAAAQPSVHFDPEAATKAYLALIPPSAKARSDSYFEGGYWLLLWDFLYGAAVALLLLNLRWSAAMRNLAERAMQWKAENLALFTAPAQVATPAAAGQ